MNFKNFLNESSSGENRKLAKMDSARKKGDSHPNLNPALKQSEKQVDYAQGEGLRRMKHKLKKGLRLGGHAEPRGPGKKTAKKALRRLRTGRELTQAQKDSLKAKFKNTDALNAAADEMGSDYVGTKVYDHQVHEGKKTKAKSPIVTKKGGKTVTGEDTHVTNRGGKRMTVNPGTSYEDGKTYKVVTGPTGVNYKVRKSNVNKALSSKRPDKYGKEHFRQTTVKEGLGKELKKYKETEQTENYPGDTRTIRTRVKIGSWDKEATKKLSPKAKYKLKDHEQRKEKRQDKDTSWAVDLPSGYQKAKWQRQKDREDRHRKARGKPTKGRKAKEAEVNEAKKKKTPAERAYKALDSLSRANKTMRDTQSKLSDARKAALGRGKHLKKWQKARLEGPSRTPQKRSPALTMVMGPEKSGARWKNKKKKEEVNEGRKRLKRVGDAIAKKKGHWESDGETPLPHFKKERHHEKEGDKRAKSRDMSALMRRHRHENPHARPKGRETKAERGARLEKHAKWDTKSRMQIRGLLKRKAELKENADNRRAEDKEKKEMARQNVRATLDRVISIKGDKKKRMDIANKVASLQKKQVAAANKATRVALRSQRAEVKKDEREKQTQLEKNKRQRISRVSRESTERLKKARRDLARASKDA